MENSVLIAIGATLLFCFYKFVEMKYLDKTAPAKPLKYFVRDAIAVFSCVMCATLFYTSNNDTIQDIVSTITETKAAIAPLTGGAGAGAQVFTDEPGF